MIVKFFDQGKGSGQEHIDYLLSQEKHKGQKCEVVSGSELLTRMTLDTITRKNVYVAGVISFRPDEKLSHKKQLALIVDFERTFAPFKEDGRANFLWVRHTDKDRDELHFCMPRTDLKTGKAFNIHPPGKQNLDFFKAWVQCKNFVHQFQQVDKKSFSYEDYLKSKATVDRLKKTRAEYLVKQFDKPLKMKFNYKRGSQNARRYTQNSNQFAFRFRQSFFESKRNELKSSFVRANNVNGSRNTDRGTTANYVASKSDFQLGNYVTRQSDGFKFSSAKGSRERPSLNEHDQNAPASAVGSIEEQIGALTLQMNEAPMHRRAVLMHKIAQLQGQLVRAKWEAEQARLRYINRPKPF